MVELLGNGRVYIVVDSLYESYYRKIHIFYVVLFCMYVFYLCIYFQYFVFCLFFESRTKNQTNKQKGGISFHLGRAPKINTDFHDCEVGMLRT